MRQIQKKNWHIIRETRETVAIFLFFFSFFFLRGGRKFVVALNLNDGLRNLIHFFFMSTHNISFRGEIRNRNFVNTHSYLEV